MTIAWSRRAADELWSGVVTPLTFSLLAEPMERQMVQQRLRRAGLEEGSRSPVFRLIRGRVYVNASLIHDVMVEVPSVFLSDGVLDLLPEVLQADLRGRKRMLYDPRTLATVMRLTWNEDSWLPWSRARLFREEAARVAEEFSGFRVSPEATPERIVSQIAAVRERLCGFLDVVSWGMIYAYVFFHLALHFADGSLEAGAVPALMSGISGIRTFDAHREVAALAARVRADAEVGRRVRESPSSDVVSACERGALGEFGKGLLGVRREHGHRLVGRDLAFATWDEKPEVLVDMIRRLAEQALPDSGRVGDALAERVRAEMGRGAWGGLRRRVFDLGLSWCQEYYAVRENMRYHADYFLAAFRRLALAGARQLVKRRALEAESDVFYLTQQELTSALSRPASEEVARCAAHRRKEYEAFRLQSPPEVVWGETEGAVVDEAVESRSGAAERPVDFLATAASPGAIDGIARVVLSVDELDAIEPGEIIVATATDPTWTSYLSLASGLILEVGGLLSHGAIIAREIGIPAVVDLSDATKRIRSGDRLRVDGSTGVVQRI